MYNILLDRMPEEYEGYLIRTDYRIGMQISLAFVDDEMELFERLQRAYSLLYGQGVPDDPTTAYRGLKWFMAGGAEQQDEEQEEEKQDGRGIEYFSFEHDAPRLYSGFRRIYDIELDRVQMHWFRFLALMGDLEGSAFSEVIGYRTVDTAGMDSKTKAAYMRMKRRFALPQPESEESKEFMAALGK